MLDPGDGRAAGIGAGRLQIAQADHFILPTIVRKLLNSVATQKIRDMLQDIKSAEKVWKKK
jgi:hypothetical protein